MRLAVRRRLREVNRAFYAGEAAAFARSRAAYPPGFARLLGWLPAGPVHLLDVGCGEGRLGRFLRDQSLLAGYLGIDQEPAMLDRARAGLADERGARVARRDLAEPGALAGMPASSLVACLAALQHIPGQDARLRLLRQMAGRLAPDGRLWLSSWQFADSARQRRKLADWSAVGLTAADVEPGDALIRWGAGRQPQDTPAVRYVALLDEPCLRALAAAAGLAVLASFRSDGREGNLNLYLVLARSALPPRG